MNDGRSSTDEIKERIAPILDEVAVDGLRAWLKTIGLSSSAYTKASIADLVAKQIAGGQLTEPALEQALIGFEEASDMRVYLFNLENLPSGSPAQWLPVSLNALSIPISQNRKFAGDKTRPMTPIYAQIQGALLRIKWGEQQERAKLDETTFQPVSKPVYKRAVLIADLDARTAELRLNPPENKHSHEDAGGRITAEAYYQAYIQKARDVLGCTLIPLELRPVVKTLVEESPRAIRIHIDNHTNQTNGKMRVNTSGGDVRDDPGGEEYLKEGIGSQQGSMFITDPNCRLSESVPLRLYRRRPGDDGLRVLIHLRS
ncbi:hypothetical protein [Edaphobacter aggregans]|uniref:hypothetical protein n=1 Tax=Edaphobacter aggregans TaxID=570835 RepID=UPI0005547533|nr:hypothetical protein [Edaphobacter aggregans]